MGRKKRKQKSSGQKGPNLTKDEAQGLDSKSWKSPAIFAAVYALTNIIAGIAVMVMVSGSGNSFSWILPHFFGHVGLGLLLAVLWAFLRKLSGRLFLSIALFLSIFLNLGTYGYFAFFGELPGTEIVYYVNEFEHLAHSLLSGGWLIFWILGAIGLTFGIMFFAERRLDKGTGFYGPPDYISFGSMLLVSLLALAIDPIPLGHFLTNDRVEVPVVESPTPGTPSQKDQVSSEGSSSKETLTQEIAIYQKDLGLGHLKFHHSRFPTCAEGDRSNGGLQKRSVVILILESVGHLEFVAKTAGAGGKMLMPQLNKIAKEGLYLRNFLASGTKSNQAIPAIFAGVPPQPSGNILWKIETINLPGLPKRLVSKGYQTKYFHGGNLAFEHQRSYLEMLGFQELDEFDPNADVKSYGWGYSDGEMLDRLKNWIASRGNTPYFASLFSLSTHHPFLIPDDEPRLFGGKIQSLKFQDDWVFLPSSDIEFAESLHYLDRKVGAFYDWFMKHEAPKGSLLVLVGDHPGQLSWAQAKKQGHNFVIDVPFVLAGLSEAEKKKYGAFAKRSGAQFDIPATLSGLLGMPHHRCDVGQNLLSNTDFKGERLIHGLSKHDRSELAIFQGNQRFIYDYRSAQVGGLDGKPTDAETIRIKNFAASLYKVGQRQLEDNGFTPDSMAPVHMAPDLEKEPLIFASHRGNYRGSEPKHENTLEAIEKAYQSGFKWVEVDINKTRDGKLVAIHDRVVRKGGEKLRVMDLTYEDLLKVPGYERTPLMTDVLDQYASKLNFLFELKPQPHVAAEQAIAFHMLKLLRRGPKPKKFIIDSFSDQITISLGRECDCDIAYDIPQQLTIDEPLLKGIRNLGFRWVYVDNRRINKDMVTMAHNLGLKVMAYTVAQKDTMSLLHAAGVDGVISDIYLDHSLSH